MKKFLSLVAAIMAVFVINGCDVPHVDFGGDDDDDGTTKVCVVYSEDGYCMAYTTIEEATPAEDGLSAYELAVQQGYVGTLDAWLISLVGNDGLDGEDGVDGICPVCDSNITDPEDGNETDPVINPLLDSVLLIFKTDMNITNLSVAHFIDGSIVSTDPVELLEGMLEVEIPIDENGTHGVGLQFDKE